VVDAEDDFRVLADREVPHPEAASLRVLGVAGPSFPGESPSQPMSAASRPDPPAEPGDTPPADEPPRGPGE
jgi:hypothetical protein